MKSYWWFNGGDIWRLWLISSRHDGVMRRCCVCVSFLDGSICVATSVARTSPFLLLPGIDVLCRCVIVWMQCCMLHEMWCDCWEWWLIDCWFLIDEHEWLKIEIFYWVTFDSRPRKQWQLLFKIITIGALSAVGKHKEATTHCDKKKTLLTNCSTCS